MATLTRREKLHQLKRLGLNNRSERSYWEKDYNSYIKFSQKYAEQEAELVVSEDPLSEIIAFTQV